MERHNQKRKQNKIQEGFSEVLENTTIHGLNHYYSAKIKIFKIAWLILFICSIAGLSFNLIFIIQKYMSNPILISHFADYERFVWPDLTFCYPSLPYDFGNNPSASQYWKSTLGQATNIVSDLVKESKLFQMMQSFNEGETDTVEKAVMLSTVDPAKLQIDEIRKRIWFYGFSKNFDNIYLTREYDHYATNFVKESEQELFSTKFVQIRNNVPCYTFQIEKSKSINSSSVHSIFFFIDLNYESYKIFNSSYIPRSVFLYITPQNILPQTDETVIMAGYNTEIDIDQTRYKRSGIKGGCSELPFKIGLYDTLLSSIHEYEGNYEDCKKIVSQSLYVERCNCFNPFLPIYDNKKGFPKMCFNLSIYSHSEILQNAECIFQVFDNYSKNSSFAEILRQMCDKYRNVKCNYVSYKSEHEEKMRFELNLDELNDRMIKHLDIEYEKVYRRSPTGRNVLREIKQNLAMLSIKKIKRFGDLITEEPQYSEHDLMSDIGGLMGLWLGLSIIGLCEVCTLVYFIFVKLIVSGFNKTQPNKKTDTAEDYSFSTV